MEKIKKQASGFIDEKTKKYHTSYIEEYIEKHIEKKLNSLLKTLPSQLPNNYNIKPFYELTIKELYKNTLQITIDIINDFADMYSKKQYIYDSNMIINIITKDNRKIYVGILIIFISFIMYFIDGVSV